MKGKIITEEFVKNSIIKWLSANRWGHFQFGGLRDHGADIRARHVQYARFFLIETKGESFAASAVSQRETAFVYSLGQIITRMKSGARDYYGLGLPDSVANIAKRRIPWKIAKKLLLYIFSVNNEGKVNRYTWQDLKNLQSK